LAKDSATKQRSASLERQVFRSQHGFFAGDNGAISRSLNGGATWASIQSGGAGVTHKFDFVDARHAWAGQDAGEIVYTLTGGRQWIRATVGGFDAFGKIMALAFANTSTGWAGGNDAFFGGSNGIVCARPTVEQPGRNSW
jgi:photosystem II stability/assembly factor-like uncharacterized protein